MSEQRITITGQTARIESIDLIAEAPLQALAPFLTTQIAITFPILPKNTVFIAIDPEKKQGLVIVEREPVKTGINISGEMYSLRFPYQYFAYSFNIENNTAGGESTLENFSIYNSMLFWRPAPYRVPTDVFYVAKIPNVDHSAGICWGGTYSDEQSFAGHVNELTNTFNTTIFNSDLGYNSPGYGEDYRQWEAESDDPLLYEKWEYWQNCRTNGETWTAKDIWANSWNGELPRPVELAPSFVHIPEAPTNFTHGRAVEWLSSLEDGPRRRIIAAARQVGEDASAS